MAHTKYTHLKHPARKHAPGHLELAGFEHTHLCTETPNHHQSQASEPPHPHRVRGSVFGSVSVLVGGLQILTTGSAPCTLMQHAPPLRVLHVPAPPKGESFYSVSVCVCVLFDICCVVCACALFSAPFTLTHRLCQNTSRIFRATTPPTAFLHPLRAFFFSSRRGFFSFARTCFSVHRWPVFKALPLKNKHPEFK